MAIIFKLTDEGRQALINTRADGLQARTVSSVGITATAFTPLPLMDVLPNEIKRITTLSGASVAPGTIHITVRDDGSDAYTVRGLGIYLDNGVLLGTYSQPGAILEKTSASIFLLSTDLRVLDGSVDISTLLFGDASFITPPATTEVSGVVELATAAEVQAGTDTVRAVTPAGLKAAIDATAVGDASATVAGKVVLATNAEAQKGTNTAKAVTPAALAARTATDARAGLVELATTAEATTGTDTARAVTPAGLKAAINAAAVFTEGQTWQDVKANRAGNTIYTNTTGRPIQVSVSSDTDQGRYFKVRRNSASAWVNVAYTVGYGNGGQWNVIVPNGHEYQVTNTGAIAIWSELR